MPERSVWYAKGTEMRAGNVLPSCQPAFRPSSASSNANSHSPFRLNHKARANWGRGYSGRGISLRLRVFFAWDNFVYSVIGRNSVSVRDQSGGALIAGAHLLVEIFQMLTCYQIYCAASE